jgi:hypothetical protein
MNETGSEVETLGDILSSVSGFETSLSERTAWLSSGLAYGSLDPSPLKRRTPLRVILHLISEQLVEPSLELTVGQVH